MLKGKIVDGKCRWKGVHRRTGGKESCGYIWEEFDLEETVEGVECELRTTSNIAILVAVA